MGFLDSFFLLRVITASTNLVFMELWLAKYRWSPAPCLETQWDMTSPTSGTNKGSNSESRNWRKRATKYNRVTPALILIEQNEILDPVWTMTNPSQQRFKVFISLHVMLESIFYLSKAAPVLKIAQRTVSPDSNRQSDSPYDSAAPPVSYFVCMNLILTQLI